MDESNDLVHHLHFMSAIMLDYWCKR
jgi:hypothetical protein